MRAVILAAGRGQRLMPYTTSKPKCLVAVLGKPIVQWQIDLLLDHGIEQVTVVTVARGYRHRVPGVFVLVRGSG